MHIISTCCIYISSPYLVGFIYSFACTWRLGFMPQPGWQQWCGWPHGSGARRVTLLRDRQGIAFGRSFEVALAQVLLKS